MAQPHNELADELERAIGALEALARDVRAGIRGADHYDRLEERAQEIRNRIAVAFRGSTARPTTANVVPGRNGGVWAR